MSYQLLTHETPQGPRGAVHIDGQVYDIADVTGNSSIVSVLDALKQWETIRPLLKRFAAAPEPSKVLAKALSEVKLLAPNPNPGSIFCAGGAYNDHGGEMDNALNMKPAPTLKERGEPPFFFMKNATGVCGPGSTTTLDAHVTQGDWEVELVVVIGQRAKDVPEEEALDYVAGFTVGNDLSQREHVRRNNLSPGEPFLFDWFAQKCFDGSCPTGPWIVPVNQIKDLQNLSLKLWVGDELMQDTSTRHMIFSVQEQVAALSRQITLYPGDMIMTGTGGGVGLGRGRFLQRGETVRASVEGVGDFIHHIA
jgi:2-keto-4-pentenoate hydratase/2-oxohepta-3-ene-1,7-dioic acid hydratase in catechol pathway